jgi:M6 family metalloprotease-like protein
MWRKLSGAVVLVAAVLVGIGSISGGSARSAPLPAAPPLVPLWGWYSEARDDYLISTDPAWTTDRVPRSGYTFERVEGFVFSPSSPQPPDTVRLSSWFNPSRGDNFTTSDPTWQGNVGRVKSGYTLFRIEGFVFENTLLPAGTLALRSYYSETLGDNRATTFVESVPPGLGYAGYRNEGFIYSPGTNQPPLTPEHFGYAAQPVLGNRPLLVIRVRSDGVPSNWHRDAAHFQSLVFGPIEPNLLSLFRDNSQGRFQFTKAGVGVTNVVVIPGNLSDSAARAAAVKAAAEAGEIDLDDYDDDGNGVVSETELAVLYVNDSATYWGQTDCCPVPVCPVNSSVCYQGKIAGTWQDAPISLMAHELGHEIGQPEHNYGTGMNNAASFMGSGSPGSPAASTSALRESFHVDPFNKMRWGWIRPRIVRSLLFPGGCQTVQTPAQFPASTNAAPVLLTDSSDPDPKRFFLLEYRSQNPTGTNVTRSDKNVGYDRDRSRFGVAIWYVEHSGGGNSPVAPGGPLGPGVDGTLQTTITPDDQPGTTGSPPVPVINVGKNRWPDSTPQGDDAYLFAGDLVNWIVASPSGSEVPKGTRGETNFWSDADNRTIKLDFTRGRKDAVNPNGGTAVRIAAATASSKGTTIELQGGSSKLASRLDSLESPSVARGGTLSVRGMVGVGVNGRKVTLSNGANSYTLSTTGWTCSGFNAVVPGTVVPGTYDLTVWNSSAQTARGNRLRVTVT